MMNLPQALRWFMIGLGFVILMGPGGVSALDHHEEQAHSEASFDLSEVTCWDVATMEEQTREQLLLLIYGFASGSENRLVHSGESIESSLLGLRTACNDDPDASILDVISLAPAD